MPVSAKLQYAELTGPRKPTFRTIRDWGHRPDLAFGAFFRRCKNGETTGLPYAASSLDDFFAEAWRAYLGANDAHSLGPTVTRARPETQRADHESVFEGTTRSPTASLLEGNAWAAGRSVENRVVLIGQQRRNADMNGALTIEVRILDDRIREWGLPRYGSAMAAAVDLFACVDEPLEVHPQSAAVLIPSGIAVHIGDPAIAGLIVPRSGLGHRHGVVLGNLVGVLDADYSGPLLISVWNRSPAGSAPVRITPGDRIAQLLFVPVARPALRLVDTFSKDSARGDGGFGSTGIVPFAGQGSTND